MLVLVAVLVLLIPILAIVLDSDVGKAIARRLDRKSLREGDGAVHDRLVYLESELERLTGEVGRLDEENQFFQRLLSDRSERRSLPDRPGSRDEPPDPER